MQGQSLLPNSISISVSLWADLAWADLWLTKVAEGEDAERISLLFFYSPLFVLLGEETGTIGWCLTGTSDPVQ